LGDHADKRILGFVPSVITLLLLINHLFMAARCVTKI